MASRRVVTSIQVEDVEKRRQPSKHYVYMIFLKWSDGSTNVVYRRYSKFFELQSVLLDKFAYEAGTADPNTRSIPFLPGKILLGRSHIHRVALQRLQPINNYCQKLIQLPAKISESKEVLDFFEPRQEDLEPVQTEKKEINFSGRSKISGPLLFDQYVVLMDYRAEAKTEVDMTAGQTVEVVEKSETGWWFVSTDEAQGWAPSSYLEKCNSSEEDGRIVQTAHPGQGDKFICHRPYRAAETDEVSLDKGCLVEVLERNLDGWWLVRYKGNVGRAPATNLAKADTLKAQRFISQESKLGVQIVSNVMEISNLRQSQDVEQKASASGGHLKVNLNQSQRTPSPVTWTRKFPPPRKDMTKSKACPPRPSAPPKLHQASSAASSEPASTAQQHSIYMALEEFSSPVQDTVSLTKGETLQVLEKRGGGWWYIKAGDQEGWAPDSFIHKQTVTAKQGAKKVPPTRPTRPPAPNFKHSGSSKGANTFIETESTTSGIQRGKSNTSSQPFSKNLEEILGAKNSQSVSKVGARPMILNKPHLDPPASNSTSSQSEEDEAEYLEIAEEEYSDIREYKNIDHLVAMSDKKFVVVCDFATTEQGEVNLREGERVVVRDKTDSGWWHVITETDEGWAPSAYLQPVAKEITSIHGKSTNQNAPSNQVRKPPISIKPALPAKPKHSTKGEKSLGNTGSISNEAKSAEPPQIKSERNDRSSSTKVAQISKMFQ